MVRKPRILLISDSLGTPIHARGIFNFTCSTVQMFQTLEFDTFLLIEPPTAGTARITKQKDIDAPNAAGTKRALVADTIRHFNGDRFRFDWTFSDPSLQRFSTSEFPASDFRFALLDSLNRDRQILIETSEDDFKDYELSQFSQHLSLFAGFLLVQGVYSSSFTRASLNARPVAVDASGFDYVYIDTPHYIRVSGIDHSKVIFVAHDFIPFFDITMGFDWRQLFVKKMECTLKTAQKVVYNSETTQKYFEKIYGKATGHDHLVIYPPNRREIEVASADVGGEYLSYYDRGIVSDKERERTGWLKAIDRRIDDGEPSVPTPARATWRPGLPYFCSVLSDEPRKNIAVIVEASKSLVGVANFFIMGQIDGHRYMLHRPEDFPNLHFTGYVSDHQKYDLIKGCKAFIFPSTLEGFGIPIVEAAMFAAPVICADTDVFREVTFDRAAYFDPHSSQALVAHLVNALSDTGARQSGSELRQLAKAQFSQSAMATRLSHYLKPR